MMLANMKDSVLLMLALALSATDEADTRKCEIPDINDLSADSLDSPSPLTVNECADDGLQHDSNYCPSLECSTDCLLPDLDSRGCLRSCSCRTSGLWGDIMLTENDVAMLGSNRAGSNDRDRWTQKQMKVKNRMMHVIYVHFAPSIRANALAKKRINEAFDAYFEQTCILFNPYMPKGYSGDFIEFFDGGNGKCFSVVGRQGGMQKISIGRGCEHKGTVMHEIMHTLGFFHEQMRPDRDDHVTILTENIKEGAKGQFLKMSENTIESFGSPYDVESILHYDGEAFSKNGKPTIVDKKTSKKITAQRNGFSAQDVAQIRAMYNCDGM